jgi:replicative DNA helicase
VYNMDEARQVIDDMRRTVRVHSSESNVLSIHEAALRVLELYEYSHDNPGVSGVPSGLPGLDASTGGYQGGDLVTYVARPALGKTYILLAQVRASWGAGYSVLVVSMEMTIPQITRRLGSYALRYQPRLHTQRPTIHARPQEVTKLRGFFSRGQTGFTYILEAVEAPERCRDACAGVQAGYRLRGRRTPYEPGRF